MLPPSGADRDIHDRRRPEETPLCRIVETCYPKFLARLQAEGTSLPHFVQREFDDYLKCGLLEHGFLRVKCDACRHEHLVAFSCKRRGFKPLVRRPADGGADVPSSSWASGSGRWPGG